MKLQNVPGDLFDLAGETGLSPELLQLWQVQSGFPAVERSEEGRSYFPDWQVRRLRSIRRLIALGEPPARLFELEEDELTALLEYRTRAPAGIVATPAATTVAEYVAMLGSNAFAEVEAAMQSHVVEHGLEDFVVTVGAPLCAAVGVAWEQGRITIAQEHVFSDLLVRTLRACASTLFQPFGHALQARPRMLLCTPPGETHVLGLAMVEVMLLLQDCRAIHLGAGLPESEIARAAQDIDADIVAISFSLAHHPARTVAVIGALDEKLPPRTAIWAGGNNVGVRDACGPRISGFRSLADIPSAVEAWRHRQG